MKLTKESLDGRVNKNLQGMKGRWGTATHSVIGLSIKR